MKIVPVFGRFTKTSVFTANTTAREVTWGGKSDVSTLAGQPVRLRFELSRHAKLYSFKFGE